MNRQQKWKQLDFIFLIKGRPLGNKKWCQKYYFEIWNNTQLLYYLAWGYTAFLKTRFPFIKPKTDKWHYNKSSKLLYLKHFIDIENSICKPEKDIQNTHNQ